MTIATRERRCLVKRCAGLTSHYLFYLGLFWVLLRRIFFPDFKPSSWVCESAQLGRYFVVQPMPAGLTCQVDGGFSGSLPVPRSFQGCAMQLNWRLVKRAAWDSTMRPAILTSWGRLPRSTLPGCHCEVFPWGMAINPSIVGWTTIPPIPCFDPGRCNDWVLLKFYWDMGQLRSSPASDSSFPLVKTNIAMDRNSRDNHHW